VVRQRRLARLLLRSYAPVDGAACAPEQALFDAHRMASRRYLALLTPPFFVAISLRSLFLPPPDAATLAAVASPARPSFALLLEVYKAVQRPFALVPKGWWQSAVSLGRWTLVGCTVSPAFDFAGFELAPPDWRPTPRGST
jgi:hypothetical protein